MTSLNFPYIHIFIDLSSASQKKRQQNICRRLCFLPGIKHCQNNPDFRCRCGLHHRAESSKRDLVVFLVVFCFSVREVCLLASLLFGPDGFFFFFFFEDEVVVSLRWMYASSFETPPHLTDRVELLLLQNAQAAALWLESFFGVLVSVSQTLCYVEANKKKDSSFIFTSSLPLSVAALRDGSGRWGCLPGCSIL